MSVPTITQWLSVLEITGQILLVPPFYENFGKWLVKSPKLSFVDSGLRCRPLGIESAAALRSSPFHGAVFEGFVAAELLKLAMHGGRARNLYYNRDQRGLEVDFVVDQGNRRLTLIEAKPTRTPRPDDARRLATLAARIRSYRDEGLVVHAATGAAAAPHALRPGVRAVGMEALASVLA